MMQAQTMAAEAASEQTGRVVALEGEHALIEVVGGGCGRCHETGGCGGQQLTQMFCSTPRQYRVRNLPGAEVGDLVSVAVPAGVISHHASLAYGLPLLGLILGAMLGNFLGGEATALAGGALGMALAWWGVRWRVRRLTGNPGAEPHISRIKS